MTQGDLDSLRETYGKPILSHWGSGRGSLGTERRSCLPVMARSRIGVRMALLQGETGKNIMKGAPSNDKGWKKRFFFVSGDDWEFHPSIPREEGPRRRHFKIPMVLYSRTFHKYFATDQVKMSSSGGGTAKGDIGSEAERDIRGRDVASTGDESESSHSKDVPRPEVLLLVALAQALILGWGLDRTLGYPLSSDQMRIKLSHLTKVVAEKTATSSSKGIVIFETSKMASKKRALDDGSKGKQVAPLPKVKKTKTGSNAHVVPTRPPVPGEGSTDKSVPGEGLGPHVSVMTSAATTKKILAGVILPADKKKVEKLTFNQVVTKFLHVLGHGPPAEANTKEKKASEEVEARNKKVARLESQVAELEKSQNLANGRIIATFKESEDFQEAVVASASSYFGDGFDFCKKQLAHQYPNHGIDFDDIEMD
ncbi:hypothetical protein Acr_05g0007700 [Actinidia rufa]|uniref:Uncharacterized protein n=1 Tax=Actinidia rufa TaxID=165716 RepID=A0A7J0EKY2_9ERIC|nr:hypothetical protein Acr_05g0007700 [Actinidia rufa]